MEVETTRAAVQAAHCALDDAVLGATRKFETAQAELQEVCNKHVQRIRLLENKLQDSVGVIRQLQAEILASQLQRAESSARALEIRVALSSEFLSASKEASNHAQ